jgi:hypothetical protein
LNIQYIKEIKANLTQELLLGDQMQNDKPTPGMLNDDKEMVDLYIPRKCAATNRILHAKDKSSVQINIAEVHKEKY